MHCVTDVETLGSHYCITDIVVMGIGATVSTTKIQIIRNLCLVVLFGSSCSLCVLCILEGVTRILLNQL